MTLQQNKIQNINILKEIITNPELTINEGEAYSDNFFLSEAFDISDIKINNINIDTRCIINNDFTQLWIPKKPYEFGFVFDLAQSKSSL